MSTVFSEFSGGEVDSDLFIREGEVGIDNSGTDAFAGFRDGFVGHTDDIKTGETFGGVTFDFNNVAVVAIGNSGVYFCNHVATVTANFEKIQS